MSGKSVHFVNGIWVDDPPKPSGADFDDSMGTDHFALLMIYGISTLMLSFVAILGSCERGWLPWVPRKVYTDGVLVWFLPLIVIVPVLVWPLSLVTWGSIIAYRRAQEADEFCGINHIKLRRGYRKLRGRLRGGYEELDPEQPTEEGTSLEDVMLVAFPSTDDDGGPEVSIEQDAESSAGSKNIQDEPALTTTRGTDAESVKSEPPEYRP